MGLSEAKADLIKNSDKLYVVDGKDGQWRTTLAGTTWVMYRWGYVEGELKYELHVHGTSKFRITEDSHDAKVCGAGLKGGESRLSSEEWRHVAKKVKELVG